MKKKTLKEHSVNYQTKLKPYEEFKEAEDYKKSILSYLKGKVKNKIVFDLGCGEGTDTKILAPLSKYYYGLDKSLEQIQRAKSKCKGVKNISFINSSGEKIPLGDNSVDVVICLWVISAINGRKRKSVILKEAERILKPKGKIILVENDWQGEFEAIREHPTRTKNYNEWLIKKGFIVSKKIKTYFKFKSLEIAKKVFGQIWGKRVSNKLKNNKIEHRVIIFMKTK